MPRSLLVFFLLVAAASVVHSFSIASRAMRQKRGLVVKMEYIPDGLTKSQWEKIKQKEADELKAKGNLGAMGTTKFKSRSFEAWQKAGGKHLFPVNPNEVPYEERPYMQRKDGDWEGNDLKAKGVVGRGQGEASKRLTIDEVYDVAAKDGKLNSMSIFGGANLPWTSKAAAQLNNKGFNPEEVQKTAQRGVAGKQLSAEEKKRLEKNLVKVIDSKKGKETAAAAAPEPPKKKFGFF